jgi:hypothetical protein
MVKLGAPKLACQSVVGAAAWSVKVEAEHPVESVLVTITLYVTGVPGWTRELWPGEAVMVGADRVHGVGAMSTMIVALVLLTDSVVSLTPRPGP